MPVPDGSSTSFLVETPHPPLDGPGVGTRKWPAGIRCAVMDMSRPYKATFDTVPPDADQVINPSHLRKTAELAPSPSPLRNRPKPSTIW